MDFLFFIILYLNGISGPNSNSVEKKSPNYIETYLVEAYSLIIVKIDARGSGLRGWNLKHKIYRHLGGPEIEDQLEILRYKSWAF
jgi:dipeptidyl aminopeptidase/acylaminoacyl peptidase